MQKIFKCLMVIILILLISLGIYRHMSHLPLIVHHYQGIMKEISSENNKRSLREWVENGNVVLTNDYGVLLDYIHIKLDYTEDPYIIRHEDPIEILSHKQPERLLDGDIWNKTGKYGTFGRCGEFAIAYTALLLAYGFDARMVVCLTDHVWTEVKVGENWLHIDPTEYRIDDPSMYERDWEKNFDNDRAYAIEPNKVTVVTNSYRYNLGD